MPANSVLIPFPRSPSEPECASGRSEQSLEQREHFPNPSSMIRFNRLLRKIETANVQNSCARLTQDWEGVDTDLEAEFRFETSLWALVGMEKMRTITQPSETTSMRKDGLDGSCVNIQDGMDVLHLGPGYGKQSQIWFRPSELRGKNAVWISASMHDA
jgi:hypothetical protein